MPTIGYAEKKHPIQDTENNLFGTCVSSFLKSAFSSYRLFGLFLPFKKPAGIPAGCLMEYLLFYVSLLFVFCTSAIARFHQKFLTSPEKSQRAAVDDKDSPTLG